MARQQEMHEAELEQLRATIQQLNTQLREKDVRLKQREGELQEKEDELHQRDAELQQQNIEVNRLQRVLEVCILCTYIKEKHCTCILCGHKMFYFLLISIYRLLLTP